jgi:predicted CoA-binding protein
MQYLLKHGFHVLPVNPNARQILGQRSFGSIDEIGEPIDTVVCFRRSEYLEPIARSAVAAHAKHLWMQFGVINERAAEVAEKAGLVVVMDRCIMVDHRRIEGEKALDEPQRAN